MLEIFEKVGLRSPSDALDIPVINNLDIVPLSNGDADFMGAVCINFLTALFSLSIEHPEHSVFYIHVKSSGNQRTCDAVFIKAVKTF